MASHVCCVAPRSVASRGTMSSSRSTTPAPFSRQEFIPARGPKCGSHALTSARALCRPTIGHPFLRYFYSAWWRWRWPVRCDKCELLVKESHPERSSGALSCCSRGPTVNVSVNACPPCPQRREQKQGPVCAVARDIPPAKLPLARAPSCHRVL